MIDILLIVFGLWAIISGKFPSWLIGGGKYKIEGKEIRFLGVFLLFMFPIGIVIARLLVSLGIDSFLFLLLADMIRIIITVLIANIVIRRVRKPIGTVETIGIKE